MHILLVINPIAGDKNKSNFLDFAKQLMDDSEIDYGIYKTTGKQDYKTLQNLLKKHSPKKIIIVGGDGTLNMFLKLLIKNEIQVGFIPMGSANGMAVELDLTDKPETLFEKLINSKKAKKLDVLTINGSHVFLHLGDIGANANLVANYDKDDERGMLTYAKYFWSEFKSLKRFEFKIETDETVYKKKGIMLGICNGRRFGTGVPLNSIGKMDDGIFEIVIVRAMNFSDLLKAALSKFDEDYNNENLETIQAKTATIKLKQPQLLQIDGEVIQEFKNLNIEVLPKSLLFIQHEL